MTAKMVSAYLTANDFQHTLLGEDEDVIKTGMGGLDNIDHLELYLFFDEDGSYQNKGICENPGKSERKNLSGYQ